jgi:hypothetical protein
MNRRAFLAALAAGLVLDPERLLYVPGKKLISIPKPRLGPLDSTVTVPFFNIGDIVTFAGRHAVNPLTREELTDLQEYRVTHVYESGQVIARFVAIDKPREHGVVYRPPAAHIFKNEPAPWPVAVE